MPKKIIIILALFFSYAVFAQDSNSSSKQGMKANFSTASIKAYQKNSFSKISDFYQYLEILSDASAPKPLKNQVRENINSLFANQEIELVDFTSQKLERITLEKLLQKLENEKNIQFTVKEENTNETSNDYWLNSYMLEITREKQSVKIPIRQKVNFYPQEKQFGNTAKQVWTITLGEIQ